eukprot:354141-Chlamydomonas_euryale.AAC.10
MAAEAETEASSAGVGAVDVALTASEERLQRMRSCKGPNAWCGDAYTLRWQMPRKKCRRWETGPTARPFLWGLLRSWTIPSVPALVDCGGDSTSDTEEDYAISDGVAGKAADGPNGARPYQVAYFGGMDFQAWTQGNLKIVRRLSVAWTMELAYQLSAFRPATNNPAGTTLSNNKGPSRSVERGITMQLQHALFDS